MPDDADLEIRTSLRDGTRVLVRPLRSDDRERLRQGFELLSPRTRYLRFHTGMDHLSEAQLDHLTAVDGVDHVAWVAIDEDRPDLPGIGVARYVRMDDDPTIAEAAVTVIDEYQGRGLGTLLLAYLGSTAYDNGITTFRNYVLADNAEMLQLLDELGARRTDIGEGVQQVDVPIEPDLRDLPRTPVRRVLRSVAAGRVPVLGEVGPLRIWFDAVVGGLRAAAAGPVVWKAGHADDGSESD